MAVATEQFTGVFTADPVHSSFQFAISHMKVSTFRASFRDVEARLAAGPGGVELEGRAQIESVSITAPKELREHVVNGDEFFDGRNHPEITFRSSEVELSDDGEASVEGELTVKGISAPVTATGTYEAPIEDPYGNQRAAIELTATVDRRDWDMNWQMPLPRGGDVLGYDVELTVHLELVGQG